MFYTWNQLCHHLNYVLFIFVLTNSQKKTQLASPGSFITKDKQHCTTHDKELKQNTKLQKIIS